MSCTWGDLARYFFFHEKYPDSTGIVQLARPTRIYPNPERRTGAGQRGVRICTLKGSMSSHPVGCRISERNLSTE
eukprot:1352680-Amorphochlora_amoeboformis.AAC.1